MKIVVAEKQEEVDGDVIEASAIPAPARQSSPAYQPPLADHAGTDTSLAIPATEGTEAEVAEQAMSTDAAEVADHAAAAEPHATMTETTDDHAHTDTTLAVPQTEGTEAEAAEQAMSADAAEQADEEHHTPPDHSGPQAT